MSNASQALVQYEQSLLAIGKGEVTVVHGLPAGGSLVYVPKDADPFDLVEASIQIAAKREGAPA
jgi:hypothetical protein